MPADPSRTPEDCVLVADGDEAQRALVMTILRRHGFRVLPSVDAESALSLATVHAQDIRVAVIGTNQPGLPAQVLVSRLGALVPRMRFLIIGDYAPFMGTIETLSRSFAPVQLLGAVARLFDAAGGSGPSD